MGQEDGEIETEENLAGHLLGSQNNESAPHSLSDAGKK